MEERVLFDFESDDFSGWTVEGGNAFGPRPVVPAVDCWPEEAVFSPSYRFAGYTGNALAHTNIWASEKHAWKRPARIPAGALVSPPFTIDQQYLTFRLAGMVHPAVRVALRIEGRTVREMFGNNTFDLIQRGWEVSELLGRTAQIALEARSEEKCLLRVDDFRLTDAVPDADALYTPTHTRDCPYLRPGLFTRIAPGDCAGTCWLNDAHLLRGHDGRWHLFAVESKDREGWRPEEWDTLYHASSDSLHGGWSEFAPVFVRDPSRGEKWIRRTAIVFHDGRYYLFYNATGERQTGVEEMQGSCGAFLAVSADGLHWERVGSGPLWETPTDFGGPALYYADGAWRFLYAVPCNPEDRWPQGILMVRSSPDLMHWSEPFPVSEGVTAQQGWSLAEMRVFEADGRWYLLGRGTVSQKGRTRFHFTEVWRSENPLYWRFEQDWTGIVNVWGGSPIVTDADGVAHIAHCFFHARGVWLAPLRVCTED